MPHNVIVTGYKLEHRIGFDFFRPLLNGLAIVGCAALAVCFAFASAEAAETESVFHAANQYTVKITTRIQVPFYDDDKGTFTGTGFLVDAGRGWILTNAHVASRSPSTVRISFKGKEDIAAEKLYVDPLIDVAILQIPVKNIPANTKAAPLECRKMPKAGHPVGAFGHPWGFDYTATRGIVSGYSFIEGQHLLQTDAPVNHGNSGGPLISVSTGRVVGITSASLAERRAKRMNFAVPATYACKVIRLMKQGKDPSPTELPVVFFGDEKRGKSLKVAKVYSSSADFPLKPGDEILRVGNKDEKISNPAVLVHLMRGYIYKTVQLRITRDGRTQLVEFHPVPMKKVSDRQGVYVSGMLLSDVPFVDRQEFNLGHALMVHDIEEGSVADSMEIQDSDFLISVNNKIYQSVDSLHHGLEKINDPKKKAHFVFKRLNGKSGTLFSYHEVDLPTGDLRLSQQD